MLGGSDQIGETGNALSKAALTAANVNPNTWLATDYLNHFNEIGMLIEMLPQMPDCLGEVLEWAPKSYIEHFEGSKFNGRDVVIQAYQSADPSVRTNLEVVVAELDHQIAKGQEILAEIPSEADNLPEVSAWIVSELQPLMEEARSIINGRGGEALTDDQPSAIETLFA